MESDNPTWATFKHPDRPAELHVAPLWKHGPPSRDLTHHNFYEPCWCDYKIEIGKNYFLIIHEELQRNTFLTQ